MQNREAMGSTKQKRRTARMTAALEPKWLRIVVVVAVVDIVYMYLDSYLVLYV